MKYIKIPLDEYVMLLNESFVMNALNEVGVDNWEGYSQAFKILENEYSRYPLKEEDFLHDCEDENLDQ